MGKVEADCKLLDIFYKDPYDNFLHNCACHNWAFLGKLIRMDDPPA